MEKNLANRMQDECVIALRDIAERHGMTVRGAGGSLNDLGAILKFEFKVAGDALAIAEKAEFERYAYLFGLAPEDYGANFIANSKQYRLVAFDMKRRKYPLIAIGPDRKRVNFTDMVVDRIVQNRSKVTP